MINNLHDSKISFHAALRKRCHLYIQPQVSDPHEKILIRHWRRIWNPHFSWTQQQQNGKAKNPPFLKNETAFHAHRNNQNIPGSKCRNWRGPQWKNRKIKEKETWISEGWQILSEKEAFRRNAPGACAKKRTSSRTMNCRQQASRQKTGSYDAIGRMAFPAGVEPSLCRWRDGLPDR